MLYRYFRLRPNTGREKINEYEKSLAPGFNPSGCEAFSITAEIVRLVQGIFLNTFLRWYCGYIRHEMRGVLSNNRQ